MKFAAVWANIANQNVLLRLVIACLSLVLITLSIVTTKLAMKEPLVIERECQTHVRPHAGSIQSPEEIKAFVREVVESRFTSGVAPRSEWMAPDQMRQRKMEQEELEKKRLSQKVIIDIVDVSKSGIRVGGDRMLSVGRIRSAFPFLMDVTIETTSRSAANPYGLVLARIQPVMDAQKSGGANE
jgi:hypothetical protein